MPPRFESNLREGEVHQHTTTSKDNGKNKQNNERSRRTEQRLQTFQHLGPECGGYDNPREHCTSGDGLDRGRDKDQSVKSTYILLTNPIRILPRVQRSRAYDTFDPEDSEDARRAHGGRGFQQSANSRTRTHLQRVVGCQYQGYTADVVPNVCPSRQCRRVLHYESVSAGEDIVDNGTCSSLENQVDKTQDVSFFGHPDNSDPGPRLHDEQRIENGDRRISNIRVVGEYRSPDLCTGEEPDPTTLDPAQWCQVLGTQRDGPDINTTHHHAHLPRLPRSISPRLRYEFSALYHGGSENYFSGPTTFRDRSEEDALLPIYCPPVGKCP